tara:strand:+ start:3952 stop:4281 length:330 start_codon:yes stop_codon:yes gene_type:complete
MDLRNLIKEALYDGLFEATVIMRLDRSENLTIITDKLRGVCGITIVDVAVPSKPVSDAVERVTLKVRFFLLESSFKAQLTRMSTEARKIQGVYSFIPIKAVKYYSRIYK